MADQRDDDLTTPCPAPSERRRRPPTAARASASTSGWRGTGRSAASAAGLLGAIQTALARRCPGGRQWLAFTGLVALLPLVFESGYVRRVAFDTVLYMLLALGLNVVVGWGGLLDLGYVAFYGLGAYGYALLSSSQFDIHLLAVLVLADRHDRRSASSASSSGCRRGGSSATTSRSSRCSSSRSSSPSSRTATSIGDWNFTNGSNGIPNVDPFDLFGWELPRLDTTASSTSPTSTSRS